MNGSGGGDRLALLQKINRVYRSQEITMVATYCVKMGPLFASRFLSTSQALPASNKLKTMRIQFQPQTDEGLVRVGVDTIEHYREQLACGLALIALPASSRIDRPSLIGHALESYAYAATI